MTAVLRMAPSGSTCTRPPPPASVTPLATGPQKKQKVNVSSLFLSGSPLTESFWCKKKIDFFFFENQLSSLCKDSVVQEGLLGAQEKPGNGQMALDKLTGTPILPQIIVQVLLKDTDQREKHLK